MKKILLILLLTNILSNCFAQLISKEDAQIAALKAIEEKSHPFEKYRNINYDIKNIKLIYKQNLANYFIINLQPKGFVIISAEKQIWPLLAYSFENEFNYSKKAPSVESWMLSYEKQIIAAKNNRIKNDDAEAEWNRLINGDIKITDSKGVEPILFSTWDQGRYYNSACPEDPAGPDGHVVTGCVATALGQLCHYFRHPEQGDSSYSYIDENYGLQSVNFAEQTYNYEEMPNAPVDYHPELAKLIYHIGVSVDMHYGPDGSGMTNHKAAYSMRTFFGFHDSTQYYFRDSINVDWPGVIIEHLDQKIPMYYAGWGDTNFVSGHAFVCDGYQDSSFFHFNWGWGGSFDGYFYFDDLTPGGSNFTLLHELVVNMVPKSEYPHYFSGNKEITSMQGTIEDGSGPMYDYQNNTNCSWLLSPPDTVSYIQLSFMKFDLASGDLLNVYEGNDNTGNLIGSYTGNELPNMITSTAQQLYVTFTSDDTDVGDGFLIEYYSKRADFCNSLIMTTAEEDEITDGSGTFDYRNNSSCTWFIQPYGMQKYNFTFSEFDLEDENDYIEFRDQGYNLIHSFSGNTIPEPFSIVSPVVKVVFKSNDTITAPGWTFSYTSDTTINTCEIEEEDAINIYPNPASDEINIQINNLKENVLEVNIKSIDNKLIFSNIPSNSKTIRIPVSKYQKGIYFIEIKTDKQVYYKKVVFD